MELPGILNSVYSILYILKGTVISNDFSLNTWYFPFK